MNRTLAFALATKLHTIPYVEYYGGLVTVVSKTDTLMNDQTGVGRNVISRFPIVVDLLLAEHIDPICITMPFQIIPDSKSTGIMYFEDGGLRRAARNQFSSNLKLVCWLNIPTEQSLSTASDFVILSILERLKSPFNSSTFTKIQVVSAVVNRQGESNFAAYTYDQNIRQYLMPPYEHFSIDLTVVFDANLACLLPPTLATEC